MPPPLWPSVSPPLAPTPNPISLARARLDAPHLPLRGDGAIESGGRGSAWAWGSAEGSVTGWACESLLRLFFRIHGAGGPRCQQTVRRCWAVPQGRDGTPDRGSEGVSRCPVPLLSSVVMRRREARLPVGSISSGLVRSQRPPWGGEWVIRGGAVGLPCSRECGAQCPLHGISTRNCRYVQVHRVFAPAAVPVV